MIFQPKKYISADKSVSAESPKWEKAETPKPKHISSRNLGRNRTETISVCPLNICMPRIARLSMFKCCSKQPEIGSALIPLPHSLRRAHTAPVKYHK